MRSIAISIIYFRALYANQHGKVSIETKAILRRKASENVK